VITSMRLDPEVACPLQRARKEDQVLKIIDLVAELNQLCAELGELYAFLREQDGPAS
jgi:hypothetical protein